MKQINGRMWNRFVRQYAKRYENAKRGVKYDDVFRTIASAIFSQGNDSLVEAGSWASHKTAR